MLLNDFFLSPILTEGIHDPGIFKAVFMAGPPGAGKNLIIHHLGLKSFGLRMMDIDETMAYLNKSQNSNRFPFTDVGYKQVTPILTKRLINSQENMLGLIINTTGRDYEKINELKNALEKQGYDTFMTFVGVSKEVALERITNREMFATNPQDKRKVEKKYFNKAFRDCNKNILLYSMMFEDNFVFINNSFDYGDRDNKGNIIDPEKKKIMFDNVRDVRKKVMSFMQRPLTSVAQQLISAEKEKFGIS